MYTLKSIAQRGTTLGAAMALAVGAVIPAILPATTAYADALNPLTERSLTLSSSSPGWSHTDGSGNNTYAPPNSGANGQKTGNYFSFKVSTDTTGTPVKSFTFQYCTAAAGGCLAPGDDGWAGTAPSMTRNSDTSSTSDLNVTTSTPTEVTLGSKTAVGTGTLAVTSATNTVVGAGTSFTSELKVGDKITYGANTYTVASITDDTHLTISPASVTTETTGAFTYSLFDRVIDSSTGDLRGIPGYSSGQAGRESEYNSLAKNVTGNYVIVYDTGSGWAQATGWSMTASPLEAGTVGNGEATGKNNFIKLTNATGQGFTSGTQVKVLFFANASNYITNPGSKEFFVRINTYSSDTLQDDTTILDGGVTVANIMNQSIWIQTKVLETMDFSVGTVNPDTLDSTQLAASEKASGTHGICDRILTRMTSADAANVLKMGDPVAEYSLRTDTTYSTHSYWRLSSNSSNGATVYYAGHTLTNTSGDMIDPIGPVKTAPTVGSEQFGLALNTQGVGSAPNSYLTSYAMERDSGKVYEQGADNLANGLVQVTPGVDASWTSVVNASKHDNRLYPLIPSSTYADGAGFVNADYGTINTNFAFDNTSNEVPVPIATESTQVVDCVTGKMRYIANIAATTPAGIYTTKVNYIAAPQY